MRLNIFNSLIGLCVATAVVSCSDALVNDIDNRPVGGETSDMISFVVADNNNTTRGGSFGNRPCGGAYLRSANGADSLYLNMSVADIDDPITRGDEISQDALPESLYMYCRINARDGIYYYFDDTHFQKGTNANGDNVWSSNPPYCWLDNETHYKFFGYYAPAEKKAAWVKNGEKVGQERIPTIDFTTPDDVRKQFDLSYSIDPLDNTLSDANGEYIATQKVLVPVSMKHALSKVILKTGSTMAAGEITSVSIKGICDKGNLNLGKGEWILEKVSEGSDVNTTNGEFTLSGLSVSGKEQPITGENSFLLLPQKNVEGAEIEIKFVPAGKSEADTYVASLAGFEWEAGKAYTYSISISPEYHISIEIEDQYKKVDAHYVIAKAKVIVPDEATDKNWGLKVTAEDNNGNEIAVDASIVNESSAQTVLAKFKDEDDKEVTVTYQTYYEQGYWLDKISKNGVLSTDSARGSSTESGSDTQIIYIFIPENVSDEDREIIIKDNNTGDELGRITQRHPAWAASDPNFGWEQIDDKDYAQWGFYTNEKRVYVYNYSSWSSSYVDQEKTMITNLISQYNASSYVKYGRYTTITGYRYWVSIDYGSFSNLYDENTKTYKASDDNNGIQNTKDLNDFAGSAYTRDFENALKEYGRVNNSSTKAFRRRDGDPREVPQEVTSTEVKDPMLPFILRKNKYNLNKATSVVDGVEMITTAPVVSAIDWYLPAKDEFKKIPSLVDTPINPGNCWSSTATPDHNSTNSYTGSGASINRDQYRYVRVCRKR